MNPGCRIWIYRREGAQGVATHYADHFPMPGFELMAVGQFIPTRQTVHRITGAVLRSGTDLRYERIERGDE